MSNIFEKQLKTAITAYESALSSSKYPDGSDMGSAKCKQLYTQTLAAIQRVSGAKSVYFFQARERDPGKHEFAQLADIMGVCRSLLEDMQNGYLQTYTEVIHSEIFSDYLEMSEHLNASGYKDAAAVIAGSTLESHLKSLCSKLGVPTFAGDRPIKADTLNSELVKVDAYTKNEQKSVTAWLGLRNDAAHGNYNAYDSQQVGLLILSVRDFIARNPA